MELDFTVVLRGYDRAEVDAAFAIVGAALESGDPARRAAATATLRDAAFRVAWRGYDRGQVDAACDLLRAELL